ncbi:MAG: hypothetical protein AB7P94_17260 [Steroidobacteraceae bacterium]
MPKNIKSVKLQSQPIKIRKGYYLHKGQLYVPRFSSVASSVGSSDGLIQWGAGEGGKAVMLQLHRHIVKLHDMIVASDPHSIEFSKKLIEPSSINWACETGKSGYKSELTRVCDWGSNVHKAIENWLKKIDSDLTLSENENVALNTFIEFWDDVQFDVLFSEMSLTTLEPFPVGGTLDFGVEIKEAHLKKLLPYIASRQAPIVEGVYIMDLKTGSYYRDKCILQMACYKKLYEANYKRKVNGALIVNIHRDSAEEIKLYSYGKDELEEVGDTKLPACYNAWETCIAPKWYKEELNEWKNKDDISDLEKTGVDPITEEYL